MAPGSGANVSLLSYMTCWLQAQVYTGGIAAVKVSPYTKRPAPGNGILAYTNAQKGQQMLP